MARGDQLIRQWGIIRELAATRFGKSVRQLADMTGTSVRNTYRDLEVIQAAGFPLRSVRIGQNDNSTKRWFLMEGWIKAFTK